MPAVVNRSTASTTVAMVKERGAPQWFLDVLDVGTERRQEEHAGDVDMPHHTVQPGEAMATPCGSNHHPIALLVLTDGIRRIVKKRPLRQITYAIITAVAAKATFFV
jgi:hypothetical protein